MINKIKLVSYSAMVFATVLAAAAHAGDPGMASFISSRLGYISSFEAQKYTAQLDEYFQSCLSMQGSDSRQIRKVCLDQSVQKLSVQLAPLYQKQISMRRMEELRENRSTDYYGVYPDLSKPIWGVVGDSLAMGSMAAQTLQPNLFKLLQAGIFDFALGTLNPQPPGEVVSPVLRIYDTSEKHKDGMARAFENSGSQLIDCEECSFGYRMARAQGVPATNIFFAGQAGKRVSALKEQLLRLQSPFGYLPGKVIVSFTANDICSNENADRSGEQKYQEYYSELSSQLLEVAKSVPASPHGTEFLIVAAGDVGNLLINQKILSRKVDYFYLDGSFHGNVTCHDFREQSVAGAKLLVHMCDYILGTRLEDTSRIQHIRDLHASVVRAQRDSVKFMQGQKINGYSFRFLGGILDVEFDQNDISPDCFHPSSNGHKKIADALNKDYAHQISKQTGF